MQQKTSMLRCRDGLTFLVLAVCANAVLAGPMDGEWCSEDWGQVMFWDRDALGIGEHRICEWAEKPEELVLSHATRTSCAQIYINGDEIHRTDAGTFEFSAEMRADGTMKVDFGLDDGPVILHPCERL